MSDFAAALLFQGPCQKNTHKTNYDHINHIPIKDHAFHRPGTKRKEPAMGKALPNSFLHHNGGEYDIQLWNSYSYLLYVFGLSFLIFDIKKLVCL